MTILSTNQKPLLFFFFLLGYARCSIAPFGHSQLDVKDVFRNLSFCLYNPTKFEIILNTALLIVSMICSLGLIIHFLLVKGSNEKPADILIMVSLGEIISGINQLAVNSYCLHQTRQNFGEGSFYVISNYIDHSLENMINFYHLSFCLFHLITLKYALKGPRIPSLVYHLGPFLMSAICTCIYNHFKGLKLAWLSFYGLGITVEILLSILKYSALASMTIMFGKYIRTYLPKYEKIGQVRVEFLKYFSKYLVILRYIYVSRGTIEITTSLLINSGLNQTTTRILNIIMLFGHIMNGGFPIILALARFNDPLIRKYWDGLFSSNSSDGTQRAKKSRLELVSALIEKAVKIKPQLEQIQYSRKAQVVYSILSGIHYFWHIRESDKFGDYAKKHHISIFKEGEDSELRKEKFRVKHVVRIKRGALKREVPHIFHEIKERGYNLAQGQFTIYAQEAFNEIIELDEAQSEITKSLDLKDNLSRIYNSGINTAGKSREFFFFSKDNKFVIKTVNRSEVKSLLHILPQYVTHLKKNPCSLITKIYGIFSFKVGYSYEKFHFILMRNLSDFPDSIVSRKYDLKGSTVGRRAIKGQNLLPSELYSCDTLKDLDFNKYEQKILINQTLKEKLMATLKTDVEFLSCLGLIDYSLILYVIQKDPKKQSVQEENGQLETNEGFENRQGMRQYPFSLIESLDKNLNYRMGVIDYLTKYGLRKRLEIFFKKLIALNPKHNISAQNPKVYGERFLKYIESLIE